MQSGPTPQRGRGTLPPWPTSLEGLRALRRQLIEDIQRIERSLGQPERCTEGRRMTPAEYRDWRRRAVHVLRSKVADLRRTRDDIRRLSTQRDDVLRSARQSYARLAERAKADPVLAADLEPIKAALSSQ